MDSVMRLQLANRPCSIASRHAKSRCLAAPRCRAVVAAVPVQGRQQQHAQSPFNPQRQQWQQQVFTVYAAEPAPAAAEDSGLDPTIPRVDQDFDFLGAEVGLVRKQQLPTN